MTELIFTTLGYLFFIIFFLFLSYKMEDIVFKLISGVSCAVIMIVFVVHFMLIGYVEVDQTCAPDVIRESDGTAETWDFFTNSKEIHAQQWNIPYSKMSQYKFAEMCLDYNNTDGANEIALIIGKQDLADVDSYFTYAINETVGQTCINVNVSDIKDNVVLGFSCEDCAPGNQLGIGQDTTSPDNVHLYSTGATISYSYLVEDPHLYELRLYPDCREPVRHLSFYFWLMLAIMILCFGLAVLYKVVSNWDNENKYV